VKTFPLEPVETARPEALKALQLERLQWSLQHAYNNVPHYRRKFDAAGVKPGDCRSLEDLARFPFTTKADLRDTYPFGMFAVPRKHYCACTPRPAPPESRPSSATPAAISTAGAT
jgi:phenylacetate-CoA ligase